MAEEIHLPEDLNRLQRTALLVGVIGLALGAVGFLFSRVQFLNAYLFAWFFWLGVTLGSMAIVMLHHLTRGDWGMVIRRICEAAALTLPLLAVLFIPIALGTKHLFPWATPQAYDEPVRHVLEYQNRIWFNVPGFVARAIIYFVVWIVLICLLRSGSIRFDLTENFAIIRRIRRISAGGLVIYMVTMTLASVDWIMAREAGFYSTIIGFMIAVGQTLSGMVFAIALLPMLSKIDSLAAQLTLPRLNDLGNLMLTLVILWAYMSFAQLLIVWMANIKPETPWYVHRGLGAESNTWRWVGLLLAILHFFVPFFLLLSRGVKRQLTMLMSIALGLLVLRAIDVYWLIAPSDPPRRFKVSWMDIPLLLGIGGIWFALFVAILRRQGLIPHPEEEPVTTSEVTQHGAHGAAGIG